MNSIARYMKRQKSCVPKLVLLLFFFSALFVLAPVKQDGSHIKIIEWSVMPHERANFSHVTFTYAFEDANQYQGRISPDWPPNQSRNLSSYLDIDGPSLLSDPSCLNLTGTRLLILVQTSPSNDARRHDNRNTWMLFLKEFPKVKALFIMGQEPESEDTQQSLRNEQEVFCDILQFSFVDSYGNVTLDSMAAIQFSLFWNWGESEPDFTVIMDDDNYLYLPKLWKMLFEDRIAQWDSKSLYGTIIKGARVMIPHGNENSILYPPSYIYNEKTYPTYLNGNLYILPRATLLCLYAAAFNVPIFPINDIYVAGMLAEACQFQRLNLAGNHGFQYDRLVGYRRGVSFSFHYIKGKEKYALHRIFTEQDGELLVKQPRKFFIEKNVIHYCTEDLVCEKVTP